MKQIKLLFIFIVSSVIVQAQLTGVKNIPADYATLAIALNTLNAQGVGAGGVIINLNQPEFFFRSAHTHTHTHTAHTSFQSFAIDMLPNKM